MSAAPFTFYEFFAGGGMARAGLGPGWRCLFANDFDPRKAAVYRDNWGSDDLREGDVWTLTAADLPRSGATDGAVDLAWASSPCQDLSLAGRRGGLDGARSSAFWGFWRLIKQLSAEARAPKTIIIENVTGLMTSSGGADFAAISLALTRLGYHHGVLEIDAARFVPQSRRRMFIVCSLMPPPSRLTLLEPLLPFHSKRVVSAHEMIKDDQRAIWWKTKFPPAHQLTLASVLSEESVTNWDRIRETEYLLSLMNPLHLGKIRKAKERPERVVGAAFRRMRTENNVRIQRVEVRFDGFAGCLRTAKGGSSAQKIIVINQGEVKSRSLYPVEMKRLMGLDESYQLPDSLMPALHVLGDGVVAPVVEFLRDNLITPLVRTGEV